MESSIYRIKLEGHLNPAWSEWFDGWRVTPDDDGATLLTGPVNDQSELHGVLARIRDLNLTLVYIHRIEDSAQHRRREEGQWLRPQG